MPKLEIHPFSDDFRDDAARLLAARHARERAAEPLLPEVDDYASHVADGEGAVATRGGEVVAYLVGELADERAKVQLGGCAAAEPEAVRDLYGRLAADWPPRHQAMVPAHAPELVDVWFRSAFGCQAMLAVREAAPAEPIDFGGTIRESSADDLRTFAELEQVLWDLQREAPSSSGIPATELAEHEEGWSDLWDDADTHWSFVAERDGRAVGAIVMYRRPVGDLRVPAANVDVAFAATRDDVRGSGVGLALTHHVLTWAHARGFRSVTVDWRTINLLSSRFWPRRGFRPTHLRLYRAIP
jgi:GNAT superfamily N-acetyltransferase